VKKEPDSALNEIQRSLVERKFEILQRASFGFTQDRLLHIQEEDLKSWTDQCVEELRRKIASARPKHMTTTLIDFRQLRCTSLQCRPLPIPAAGARPENGSGSAIGAAPYS
jgi:hypothetical protein